MRKKQSKTARDFHAFSLGRGQTGCKVIKKSRDYINLFRLIKKACSTSSTGLDRSTATLSTWY
jgi:hypothetical protein